MNCNDVKDLIAGESPAEIAVNSDLQAHLTGCLSCRAFLQASASLEADIDSVFQHVTPTVDFETLLWSRIDSLPSTQESSAKKRHEIEAAVNSALRSAGVFRMLRQRSRIELLVGVAGGSLLLGTVVCALSIGASNLEIIAGGLRETAVAGLWAGAACLLLGGGYLAAKASEETLG